MTHLEVIAQAYGIVRLPNENDEHFRLRIKLIGGAIHPMSITALKLCLLLARLGIQSARNPLPIGVL